jgi:transcriptional regulator GlxA family with amidase domain
VLRNAYHHGSTVIAIDTGAFALTQAGLTGDHKLGCIGKRCPHISNAFRKPASRTGCFSSSGRSYTPPAACNLLFYEEAAIKDVAMTCGFSYPSVLPRAFKAHFGQSPRAFRQSLRDTQGRTVRTEIRRMSATSRKGSPG